MCDIDREALARDGDRLINFAISHSLDVVSQMPRDIVREAAYYGWAKAVMKFDGRCEFGTYAIYMIKHALRQQLQQELHNHGYTVRGRKPAPHNYRNPSRFTKRKSGIDPLAFKKGLMMR